MAARPHVTAPSAVPSRALGGRAAHASRPLPQTPRAILDDAGIQLRFRFKAGELVDLMGRRTDTKAFSEAIAKLIRRSARQAAREPRALTRKERAEALWAEIEKRFPPSSATRSPGPRSLSDYVHPEFLPVVERRRQSHRVADARKDVPEVGPPRANKLVVLPVDDDSPYSHARRIKAWLPHTQRETWTDLNPGHDGGGIGRGDGDVLAFLGYVGVTPDEWEALPHDVRLSIRESVRALLVIPNAIAAALDPVDPTLVQRALALLRKLGKAGKSGGPSGFETALVQRERWAAARGLYLFLTHLFDIVKEHFRPALIEQSGRKAAQLAAEVNVLLTERYGSYAARCNGEDIEALFGQSSADVAKPLVRRIDPKIDIDALDRARPRHRNRSRNKPRKSGPRDAPGQ